MKNLQIFNNELFSKVRTVTVDRLAWIVAKDVLEALELTPESLSGLDEYD